MTEIKEFVSQVEHDLRNTRSVSNSTLCLWENLSQTDRASFATVMAFLGCSQAHEPQDRRIAAARLLFLKLGLDSANPRWSSSVLERLIEVVLAIPGGTIGDLFHALFGILGDYPSALSRELANFIKDFVKRTYTAHQAFYSEVEWQALAQSLSDQATKPQLYLALHAVPPYFVTPKLAGWIADGLQGTPYHDEAINLLAA